MIAVFQGIGPSGGRWGARFHCISKFAARINDPPTTIIRVNVSLA